MVTIIIRDKQTADEQNSPYVVLVTSNATSHSAYRTIGEFMAEWHDTLTAMKLNSISFAGQKSLALTADYSVTDASVYTKELEAMASRTRKCDLLSNGSMKSGAILVDAANRQTTFFRLNPNDKEY